MSSKPTRGELRLANGQVVALDFAPCTRCGVTIGQRGERATDRGSASTRDAVTPHPVTPIYSTR